MRRLTALFAAAVLLLTACGGKQNEEQQVPEEDTQTTANRAAEMTIVETSFSQETEDILKLLDTDGLGFYDFAVNETVGSFSLDVWVLSEGKWVNSGGVNGNLESGKGRVGVQLLEDGCNFFQLKDTGHIKYSVKYNSRLDECTAIGKLDLGAKDTAVPIQANQEQFLIMELGWEDDKTDMNVMTEDFRNSDCDAGVAVTITFTAASSAGAA